MSILDRHYLIGKNLGIKKPHIWKTKSPIGPWVAGIFLPEAERTLGSFGSSPSDALKNLNERIHKYY